MKIVIYLVWSWLITICISYFVSVFCCDRHLFHTEQADADFLFVPFFRSQDQMGGRRWVWRVIPLHLSINLETISSIPYRMSKPRWAEDESIIFFRRLSLEFPSKHINTSCAIIFYCPSSLSVDGGPREWVNAVEWVVFYAKEKLYLRTTGCDRILSLSLRSLCMGSDGACARDLLSNRKWDT